MTTAPHFVHTFADFDPPGTLVHLGGAPLPESDWTSIHAGPRHEPVASDPHAVAMRALRDKRNGAKGGRPNRGGRQPRGRCKVCRKQRVLVDGLCGACRS